jgi:hypothetical protein
MTTCPKCGHDKISTERRMDGNHHCQNCKHVWPNKKDEPTGTGELKRYGICGEFVKFTDAQAALAERDKRIKELEDALRRITKCNKEFCDWLGIRNCTDNHGKHECFCIYCEVERAKEALEGK